MRKKTWKTLKKFKNIPDDIYQVSIYGDVRIKNKKKTILNKKIANKKSHPYYAVYLHNEQNKGEWILVHQLVAHCFIPIPSRYKNKEKFKELVPDHLDNNGLNNFYKNLEWKTRGENVKAAFERGEINHSGENNFCAIITDDQARQVCKYLEDGLDYDMILKNMNFPNNKSYRTLLVRIKNRIAWKSISKDYTFDKRSIKYTKTQLETISKIPKIKELISYGKTNTEIARILWPEASKAKIGTKAQTVGLIRRNKIFKELLQGSTTIETISSQEIVGEKKGVE